MAKKNEEAPALSGAVWRGTPAIVTNRFGEWEAGKPRYDLTPEQVATLPDEFERVTQAQEVQA